MIRFVRNRCRKSAYAESGIKTFRDLGGLWEGHDVTKVASPEGFAKNPQLVLDFYNQRRRQAKEAQPNKGHRILAELESDFEVTVITQNVDDLHEKAGSSCVLHLHGELDKAQSTVDSCLVYQLNGRDILVGDTCAKGSQLRPYIVWFGEMVPNMETAIASCHSADAFLVVGTSMQFIRQLLWSTMWRELVQFT